MHPGSCSAQSESDGFPPFCGEIFYKLLHTKRDDQRSSAPSTESRNCAETDLITRQNAELLVL